jgi:hypothetical protein
MASSVLNLYQLSSRGIGSIKTGSSIVIGVSILVSGKISVGIVESSVTPYSWTLITSVGYPVKAKGS